MGHRANLHARHEEELKKKEQSEPETVLTFNPHGIDDPILNPPKKKTFDEMLKSEEGKVKLPDHVAAAINSNEPLQVTDDPEKVGTFSKEEDAGFVPPLKAALNELDLANANKRALLAKANAQREAFMVEQSRYEHHRRLRAVPILAVPSGMIPYPEGVKISYIPYSVRDLEDINNDDIPLADKYQIMLEGIITEGMLPTELTFADFMFIADTRHLQALGDVHFKYPYVCKSCGKPGTYQFQLSDIGFVNLTARLPVNVRFYSFPDDIFQFVPHTIGDVILLLNTDRYWKKLSGEYLVSEEGQKYIDRVAINACRCISHPWETAYFKLLEVSENPSDRVILEQLDDALYHSTEPIKFRCVIPLDKAKQREMAVQTANLVQGVASGELSTTTPNDEKEDIAPWAKGIMAGTEKDEGDELDALLKDRICNAVNTIDVLAGDIIIPFRKPTVNLEYGILSSEMGEHS